MKNELKELEYYNSLLDIYGSLLTKNMYKIIESYYIYNLSMSEIANNLKISKSAVKDSLDKSKLKLDQYEEKLKFYKKRKSIIKILNLNNIDENILNKILKELM
ncbi:MAG: hypothetical protein ACTTID_03645 [Bacillales bacterium]